jgi:hypothetical protein
MIASGEKRIENREWGTSHRGMLAIHAGKSLRYYDGEIPKSGTPFGAIIAVAELLSCSRRNERFLDWCGEQGTPYANHAEGRICWVFDNIRPLANPIKMNGARGLFDVPAELARQVLAQLEKAQVHSAGRRLFPPLAIA